MQKVINYIKSSLKIKDNKNRKDLCDKAYFNTKQALKNVDVQSRMDRVKEKAVKKKTEALGIEKLWR